LTPRDNLSLLTPDPAVSCW